MNIFSLRQWLQRLGLKALAAGSRKGHPPYLSQAWFSRRHIKRLMDPLYAELPQYSPAYLTYIFANKGNIIRNGAIYNAAIENNPYVHIADGIRQTIGQPETPDHNVYLLGPSYVYGVGAEDAHTIASFLQEQLNGAAVPRKYAVHNYGVRGSRQIENYFLQLRTLNLREGDFVFILYSNATTFYKKDIYLQILLEMKQYCERSKVHFITMLRPTPDKVVNLSKREKYIARRSLGQMGKEKSIFTFSSPVQRFCLSFLQIHCINNGIPCFDLQPLFNRPHSSGELFIDKGHWNYKGNKIIANFIFTIMQDRKVQQESTGTIDTFCSRYIANLVREKHCNEDIEYWIRTVVSSSPLPKKGGRIGSIVMNANPFTYGHLYLIEQAIERVDALYIFVVEENKSFFSFDDRFSLIKKGIEHLKKPIFVIPSGNFIISSFTFPGYFTKDTERYNVDSSLDILLYGAVIAPALGITDRFVGEEPSCNVTSAYNETMFTFLPKLQVNVHVIPRKVCGDVVISASIVRQYLARKDFEALRPLVPPSTYTYLLETFGAS